MSEYFDEETVAELRKELAEKDVLIDRLYEKIELLEEEVERLRTLDDSW